MLFSSRICFIHRRIHSFRWNPTQYERPVPDTSDWWTKSRTFRDLLTTARDGKVAKEICVEKFLRWSVDCDDRNGNTIHLTDMLWCIEKRRIDHEFLMMRLVERDSCRSTWIRLERDTHSWRTALPLPIPAQPDGWNRKDTILIAADGRSLLKQNEPQYCHAHIIFHNRHLTILNLTRLLHSCGAIAKNYNLLTFNCYWFARTIWWDLAKYTGGHGLEFQRPGQGPIDDVVTNVEARSETKAIMPPGDMEAAIQFTRFRLKQHIAKSAAAIIAACIVAGSMLVMPRSGWVRFSKNFDQTEAEIQSVLEEE